MRIPGRKILRQGLWRLRGTFFGGGVILGYHRVADDPTDSWDLCAPPAMFDEQMEVLCRDFHPVPLTTLTDGTPAGSARSPLPVAVTFDDGYADVLHEAVPVLERRGVPATVFVVQESLGARFWWDRLQRILEIGPRLPDRLDLHEGTVTVAWTREQGTEALGLTLYSNFGYADGDLRDELLTTLEAWAEQQGAKRVTPPALLSAEQVRELNMHGLVDIGSHGASHDKLAGLDPTALEREIDGSRRQLEALLGEPVRSFSYPHGVLDEPARDRVARAGYDCACASWNGLVTKGTDPFRLPRLWPSKQNGSEFRRWLRSWTGR